VKRSCRGALPATMSKVLFKLNLRDELVADVEQTINAPFG
jgi:hypothetical protein